MNGKLNYFLETLVYYYQKILIKTVFTLLKCRYIHVNKNKDYRQAIYIVSHDYSHIDILTITNEFIKNRHNRLAVFMANKPETRIYEKIMLAKYLNWKGLYVGSVINNAIKSLKANYSLVLFVTNITRNRKKMGMYSILKRYKKDGIPIVFIKIKSNIPSLVKYKRDFKQVILNSLNTTYTIEYLDPVYINQFESNLDFNRYIFKTLYNVSDF